LMATTPTVTVANITNITQNRTDILTRVISFATGFIDGSF